MINFIYYFMYIIPIAFAVVSAFLLVWCVYCCSENVLYGAALIAISYVLETAFVVAPQVSMGIMVSSNDCMVIIILLALALRCFISGVGGGNYIKILWLMLFALFLYNISIGLLHSGTKAGVEARNDFYFIVVGLYFISFKYSDSMMRNISKIGMLMVYTIVLICAYRFIGVELGFVSKSAIYQIGASNEFRVVGSGQVLMFAAVGGIFFHLWLIGNDVKYAYLSVLFFLLVIVLQHRSVWVSSIFLLLTIASLNLNLFLEKSKQIIPAFIFITIVVLFIFAYHSESILFDSLGKSIVTATDTENGTQVDRWESWIVLIERWANSSIGNYLTGLDYGSGWDRYQRGRFLEFAPHNQYVYQLLRQGVIGLFLFLSILAALITWLKKETPDCKVSVIFFSLLISLLVYYIPYQLHYLHAVFLGLCISFLSYKNENLKCGN